MYSEKFIDYLLRCHSEPKKKSEQKAEKRAARNTRPHFGFIYAKMMRDKYYTDMANAR